MPELQRGVLADSGFALLHSYREESLEVLHFAHVHFLPLCSWKASKPPDNEELERDLSLVALALSSAATM